MLFLSSSLKYGLNHKLIKANLSVIKFILLLQATIREEVKATRENY